MITQKHWQCEVFFFLKKFEGDITKRVLFIDQSVYDADQNYRLPLSAKFADIGKRHFKY